MSRPCGKRKFVADCSSSLKHAQKELCVTDNKKATKQRYFYCPHYVNAPHKHRPCLGYLLSRESDVRQHINRVHSHTSIAICRPQGASPVEESQRNLENALPCNQCGDSECENHINSHQYQPNEPLKGLVQLPFPPIMLSFYHAVYAAVFVKLSTSCAKMSQDASIGSSPGSIHTFLRTFILTDKTSVESSIDFATKLAYDMSKEGLDITLQSAIDKAFRMSDIDRESQLDYETASAFIEASGGCSNVDGQISNRNLEQDFILSYNTPTTATVQTMHDTASSYNNSLQDETIISIQAPGPLLSGDEHSSFISLQNIENPTPQSRYPGDSNNSTASMSGVNLGSNMTHPLAMQYGSYCTGVDGAFQYSYDSSFLGLDTESGQQDSAGYVSGI